MNSFVKQFFAIYPDLPLHKNWSFWLAIVTPALIAAVLLILAAGESQELCFSSACQNNLLESNKLPIGVLSLSVLFGVMVGRFHGSAQRIASYKQTEKNNTFRNFYDHRELFYEWVLISHEKQVKKLQYVTIESTASLYHSLFEKNSPSFVEVEIPKEKVKEIYNCTIKELHVMVNEIGLACQDRDPPVGKAAMNYVTQTIDFTNNYIRQFGIQIKAAEDWPDAQTQNHEFSIIAGEIAYVLKLAFGFSARATSLQLSPDESFRRLAIDDKVAGVVTSALVFGKDGVTLS